MINQLKEMYKDYCEKSLEVRRKAPLFAGILGLGSDPRRHPCHEEFYEAAIAWTDGFVKSYSGRSNGSGFFYAGSTGR